MFGEILLLFLMHLLILLLLLLLLQLLILMSLPYVLYGVKYSVHQYNSSAMKNIYFYTRIP